MSQSPRIAAMIAAATFAGRGLAADARRISTLTIRTKSGPADLVSEADVRAEEVVRAALLVAEPEYGFLGEEGGLIPGADPEHVWIVDPLDGTTNFLTGSPLFAVSIALAHNGVPIAGVTHVPLMGDTFWAEEGAGAWRNGQRLHVSPRTDLMQSVLAVGIPHADKPCHEAFRTEMGRLTPHVAGIRRLGAGTIDMAWVACGRFDAYWEQSLCAWDMAAGAILVREAGGVVTDTRGGPLDLLGGSVLATTPALQAELVEALRA
jgi:myo-inositol-1(or 4)-monophosphatase